MASHDGGLSGLHLLFARGNGEQTTSVSALVTTLIPSLVAAGAFTLGFIILRKRYRNTYMPRTYLGTLPESKRTPATPTGFLNWITAMYRLPDTYVLQHHSLDAYLFLRYVKLASTMCFVGCCITWPVLFPVYATGSGGQKQLNVITFSNMGTEKARYFAPLFVSWIYIGYVFYTVTRECIYYINLRQAYALAPAYASRLSSRTVLFTTVTDDYLDREKIRVLFGRDKVKNVWLATDTSDLEDKVQQRDAAAMKLEAAETKLIKTANAARLKALKKQGGVEGSGPVGLDANEEPDDVSGSVAARWLSAKDRPTHRLKFLIGKKVDTIDWARSEIARLTPEIEELQAKHRAAADVKKVASVFVEFYTQNDAQLAYQSVAHNLPLHMAPRYIGLDPTQVIWSNLRIKWWERLVRYSATIAFVTALVIFWAIPVAAVGAISNINFLINKVHFLAFINNVPNWIKGVITGLLPVVLMSVLMALLPIILRLMAKLGGVPTLAAIELRTQNFYFAFQVVQVFLVITLASAASSVVTQIIEHPTSAANLLATHLPYASNFYIDYMILQGLSFSAGALLQIVGLLVGKILGYVLDTTPRKIYKRWSNLAGLSWGTIIPPISLLAVIAITYSAIAPLVLGFASIGIYLFYFAYRYNLLYVANASIDTQGRIYSRALQHTLVGCYLSAVCLIGLFAIGSAGRAIAAAPLILMIIFLVFMVLYHVALNDALSPLLNYLPKNLESEEEALLAADGVHNGTDGRNGKIGGGPAAPNGHDGPADNVDSAEKGGSTGAERAPAPSKQPGFLSRWFRIEVFLRWLRPDKYENYATLRRLVPDGSNLTSYSPEVEQDAYFHPSITSQLPLLWIPRDQMGVSRQEVKHTSRVIPITDEDAWLDEKNKIHWAEDKGRPPIYEEKPAY